ncbi:MAG: transferase [Desmonostoc vinosum HA7617-LM4]|jgi:carbon dioxide concentrating mechanism protein CcmN|nr:transferase [Desmonostoc vinosum HA7617-LM4]
MSVPPLRLNNNFDPYISGEVNIHPSAVLAPGVILQATANSKIIIGPGVCVGMGSILQVHEGTLEVEAGANLGAGFLMVGQGKIGTNACVGSATTVFNCSIAPGQVIPPGSILGDTSRQVGETKQIKPSTTAHKQEEEKNGLGGKENIISSTTLSASAFVELKHQSSTSVSQSATNPPVKETSEELNTQDSETNNQAQTESPDSFGTQIYGQGSIQRLLVTLFPHRQALNEPNSVDQSE